MGRGRGEKKREAIVQQGWRTGLRCSAALLIACPAVAVGAQAPKPVKAGAPAAVALPIARGFWTDGSQPCARATHGYVFDGGRWGALYFYGPNGSLGPAAELQSIVRTSSLAGGVTQMQFDNGARMRLSAAGADRAVYEAGEGDRALKEQLSRCSFASLSPRMQAALRKVAPGAVPQR